MPEGLAKARKLEHTTIIDPETGIAEVRLRITGLTSSENVELVRIRPPFCDVRGDPKAQVGAAAFNVVLSGAGEREQRFFLEVGSAVHNTECTWSYQISNAVCVSAHEFVYLPKDYPWHLSLPDGYTARPHHLKIDCAELSMKVSFRSGNSRIEQTIPVVEQELSAGVWRRNEDAERRCEIEVEHDRLTARMHVPDPARRARYGIGLKLATDAVRFERATESLELARQVAQQCRRERVWSHGLAYALSESTKQAILKSLGANVTPKAYVTGLIWQQDRTSLLTCFGDFNNAGWSVRFGYGAGVAGHAFRFASPATYAEGRPSLLYQRRTENNTPYAATYQWVVCVPLRPGADGSPVGVVSIAGEGADGVAEGKLYSIAYNTSTDRDRERAKSALSDLTWSINFAFWSTLSESKWEGKLSPGLHAFATEAARHYSYASAQSVRALQPEETNKGLARADTQSSNETASLPSLERTTKRSRRVWMLIATVPLLVGSIALLQRRGGRNERDCRDPSAPQLIEYRSGHVCISNALTELLACLETSKLESVSEEAKDLIGSEGKAQGGKAELSAKAESEVVRNSS